MESAATERAAKRLGRLGLVVFVVFFACLLDTCVARFREPLFTVHLVPGERAWVDGMLDPEVTELAQLGVETTDDAVRFRLDRLQRGFWLGGTMWVGEVAVDPGALPGVREVRVRRLAKPPDDPPEGAWRIVVHPDAASRRQSHLSLLRRHLGIAPGLAALACVPLLALILLGGWVLGRRQERRLAEEGLFEIFLSRTVPEGIEVFFGLAAGAAVEPGRPVLIVDRERRPIAEALVKKTDGKNAAALAAGLFTPLPPGACVRLAVPDSSGTRDEDPRK